MADFSNIPTGLKIPSQIPLDVKTYALNEATLAYLGIDDNLAFTYYEGLKIYCIEEKTLYEWREVKPGEENTGLISVDFTYPNLLPDTFNINYSNKTFNFFRMEIKVDCENISGTGEGVYDSSAYIEDFKIFKFKKIKSSTLIITSDENSISIESSGAIVEKQINVTGNIILNNNYDQKIVKIKNNATITVPVDLNDEFNCVFRTYTGVTATFQAAVGVTFDAPHGLVLEQHKMTTLFKDGSSETFILEGELIP